MIPSFEMRRSAGYRLVAQSWGAVAVAGVGLVGGMMSADAAGDAAEGQQASSREANQLQLAMYNNNVALQAPQLNTGNAARDRLSFLLGLSGTGFTGSTAPQAGAGMGGMGGPTTSTGANTYEQLRAQLLPQFTSQNAAAQVDPTAGMSEFQRQAYLRQQGGGGQANQGAGMGPGYWSASQNDTGAPTWTPGQASTGPGSTVDEAALDAAIRAQMAQQEAEAAQREAAARADPAFGSLAQQFEFERYTPEQYTPAEKFSYTGEDLYNDPSYKFRLEQGQRALDRQGAAAGRFLSGGQLQASSNYNQDAASQEFQNAYARAANTFGTNETNRFNAFSTNETNRANAFRGNEANRFNAYQANFTNTVNPLLSLAGSGQVAAQSLGNAGQQTATLLGNNLMGAANASGAAGIAGANAINQGLSQGVNAYQTNQLLNRFGGSLNNNPGSISAANQSGFDGFLMGNNAFGTGTYGN